MKKLFGRLARSGRQVASWYASPIGVISAIALLVALGLSVAGFAGAAVCVLAVWLGALLPYKLTRERADRLRQASSASRQISAVSQRLNRVETDLAATPTVEELSEWQEALERQSATLQAKFASLDQLRESVRLRRESMQTLHDQVRPQP
jgi:hypothetical protein